jgi:hypothetical protein
MLLNQSKAPDLMVYSYQALLCSVLVTGMRTQAGPGGPAQRERDPDT